MPSSKSGSRPGKGNLPLDKKRKNEAKAAKKSSVDSVPAEILQHMLSFLRPEDLAKASGVSKKWRKAAEHHLKLAKDSKTVTVYLPSADHGYVVDKNGNDPNFWQVEFNGSSDEKRFFRDPNDAWFFNGENHSCLIVLQIPSKYLVSAGDVPTRFGFKKEALKFNDESVKETQTFPIKKRIINQVTFGVDTQIQKYELLPHNEGQVVLTSNTHNLVADQKIEVIKFIREVFSTFDKHINNILCPSLSIDLNNLDLEEQIAKVENLKVGEDKSHHYYKLLGLLYIKQAIANDYPARKLSEIIEDVKSKNSEIKKYLTQGFSSRIKTMLKEFCKEDEKLRREEQISAPANSPRLAR